MNDTTTARPPLIDAVRVVAAAAALLEAINDAADAATDADAGTGCCDDAADAIEAATRQLKSVADALARLDDALAR